MKNLFKKTFSLFIAALMLAALTPAGFAAHAESGACGENLTWTMDDDGNLVISGTGAMEDFMSRGPWGYGARNVVIGEGVTSIGKKAFGEISIRTVSIPSTVTSIGENAFYKCYKLESITVASGNRDYTVNGGCLIETKTGTLLTAAVGSAIPDDGSVKAIAKEAFAYFDWMTDPVIPDSVTSVGYWAFDRTGYAENDDNWENGALYIGKWLVACEDYELPDRFEVKPGTVGVAGKAAMNCDFTELVLPDSLKYIGYSSFQSERKLTSLTLPAGVEVIEEWAFGYCSKITSVAIPASVRELGEYAFYACNALGGITFNEGLKSIGKCAFYTSGNYGKPTIPFSVGFIGLHAFNEDTTLRVYEYSYALRHAIENEISYELLPHDPVAVKGDFDGDGEISVADALAALRIAAKLVAETPEAVETGDTDGDGHVTVADALAILRVAAKLAESL